MERRASSGFVGFEKPNVASLQRAATPADEALSDFPQLSRNSGGNSIDFLRVMLALAVIVSHCYLLGGIQVGAVGRILQISKWGEIAVGGFFFLSGILVTRSYLSCASIWRYLWHRCLRILTGFWVCLAVTAFVFGPFVALLEKSALTGYRLVGADGALVYISSNSLLWMRQYNIQRPWSSPRKLVQ